MDRGRGSAQRGVRVRSAGLSARQCNPPNGRVLPGRGVDNHRHGGLRSLGYGGGVVLPFPSTKVSTSTTMRLRIRNLHVIRRILWQHACSIHASNILHHDLEPRNLVVSTSGEVRIIDFAFALAGHECSHTCGELQSFRELLGLA
ncbi:hypothetical protein C8R44DRAFT_272507 [Mycena epipterygia]|nr:hypothetical protein C8R44DRAFT_272507 [Mycena epipterygia]